MKKNFNICEKENKRLFDAAHLERIPEAEFIRRAIRERAEKIENAELLRACKPIDKGMET